MCVTTPERAITWTARLSQMPLLWDAIEAYSIRALAVQTEKQQALSQEALDKLASLGYVGVLPVATKIRDDAPNPRDMVHLFHDMDIGAGLFIRQDYAAAIPVFTRILEQIRIISWPRFAWPWRIQ